MHEQCKFINRGESTYLIKNKFNSSAAFTIQYF